MEIFDKFRCWHNRTYVKLLLCLSELIEMLYAVQPSQLNAMYFLLKCLLRCTIILYYQLLIILSHYVNNHIITLYC